MQKHFSLTFIYKNFKLCSQAVNKSQVPKQSYLNGETAWHKCVLFNDSLKLFTHLIGNIVGCLQPNFTMRQRHVAQRHWSFDKTQSIEVSENLYLLLARHFIWHK